MNEISDAITKAKQKLESDDQFEDEGFASIFRNYQARLKELKAFDLDDLIYLPVRIFAEDSDILDTYRGKYRWILIDEYQDINFAQFRLIRSLVPDFDIDKNLFVIGDPDQAIYGFRGADISFIKAFKEDYHNAALFRLQKSYRCTDHILQASGRMIRQDDSEEKLEVIRWYVNTHPTLARYLFGWNRNTDDPNSKILEPLVDLIQIIRLHEVKNN